MSDGVVQRPESSDKPWEVFGKKRIFVNRIKFFPNCCHAPSRSCGNASFFPNAILTLPTERPHQNHITAEMFWVDLVYDTGRSHVDAPKRYEETGLDVHARAAVLFS